MKTDDIQKAYEYVAQNTPLRCSTFKGQHEMEGFMKIVLIPTSSENPPAQFVVDFDDGMEFEATMDRMIAAVKGQA